MRGIFFVRVHQAFLFKLLIELWVRRRRKTGSPFLCRMWRFHLRRNNWQPIQLDCSCCWRKQYSLSRLENPSHSRRRVLTFHVSYHLSVNKKAREIYRPWHPSAKDAEALDETTSIPCQGVCDSNARWWHFLLQHDRGYQHMSDTFLGRRGLLNLGQTCFLNVILQSIIHNPLLRNYFLSDKHNSKLCKHKECTCCEIDKLFTEVCTLLAISPQNSSIYV